MKKTGIVFAGGGAKGAYQIGVWQALKEYGLDKEISAYSGTSVGAINAVLMAQGDFENAQKTWLELDSDTLFKVDNDIIKKLFTEHFQLLNKGILDRSILKDMIDKHINFDRLKGKEIYITTSIKGDDENSLISLVKMNYKHYVTKNKQSLYNLLSDYSEEDQSKLILASCAIPIVFSSVTVGDKTFYDGGVFDNKPIKPLIDAGCERIIVVDLFRFRNSLGYHNYKNIEFIKISPSRGLKGILDFSNSKIKRRFELGYNDGLSVLNEYYEMKKSII